MRYLLGGFVRDKNRDSFQRIMQFPLVLLRRRNIERKARALGLQSITIQNSLFYSDSYSMSVSKIVQYSLNWIFNEIILRDDRSNIVALIDSDMFFIKKINISNLVEKYPISYIPQIRSGNFEYIWTGFFVMALNKIDRNLAIDFSIIEKADFRTDVGGATSKLLEEMHADKFGNLEFVNIGKISISEIIQYETHYNGNIGINFSTDLMSNHLNTQVSNHEKIPLLISLKAYRKICIKIYNSLNLPKISPINIDFIRRNDIPNQEFFILHLKNGSNPRSFENRKYKGIKLSWLKEYLST